MDLRSRVVRTLLLAAGLFAAVGCPAALEDDFSIGVPSSSGGAASGSGGRGGSDVDASSGTGGLPGDGGRADTGGTGSGGRVTSTGGSIAGTGGSVVVPDSGPDADADPCSRCRPNETCCAGHCADLQFDARSCHSCDTGCPGTTCFNASCTNTCAQGFIDCNRNVVDGCEVNAAADPANCGNCGILCGFSQACVAGNCVCQGATKDCDGAKPNGCETQAASDPDNCGECGHACGANEICSAGICACKSGYADCDKLVATGCEASLAADGTCGSCTLNCGARGSCVAAGRCDCATGYLDCDAAVPGCETSTTDPKHCGSCATGCGGSTPACNGTACITGCGALTACGGSCVDIQTNPENCGGCGKPVGLNQVCAGGKPICDVGFADCNANPGCETNTQSDALHCGSCAGACKAGAVCTNSACACAPGTPNDCGTACLECCSSAQCSDGNSCTSDTCTNGICSSGATCAGGGSCCAGSGCFACCSDAECTGGKVCSGNQCVNLVCTPPQVICNSKCVTPSSDAANCGSCGNSCGPGRSCATAACTPKWVATATSPLVAREQSAYVAVGSKVFVWGGTTAVGTSLSDGALYDATTNTWASAGTTGVPPTPRVLATAVWTGSVVVVWGGGDAAGTTDYADGGRYDPASGTWQAMSAAGAPAPRRAAYGVWTGSRVLFYGGFDKAGKAVGSISLYDPANDAWFTGSSSGAPGPLANPTVGWSGSGFLLFGGLSGSTVSGDSYGYFPASNRWYVLGQSGGGGGGGKGPPARYGAFGTWDGGLFTIWDGASPGLKNDGQSYDLTNDSWKPIKTGGAPTSRWAPNRQTGWTTSVSPGVMLVMGGLGSAATTFFTDGGIYNSTTNAWSAVSPWPSGASHLWGVGAWTGSEFFVWGGRTSTASGVLTSAGERYRP